MKGKMNSRGFTLIEAAIVLAIILVLGLSLFNALNALKKNRSTLQNAVTTMTIQMITVPVIDNNGNSAGQGVAMVFLNVAVPGGSTSANSTSPLPTGGTPISPLGGTLGRQVTITRVYVDPPTGGATVNISQHTSVTGGTSSVIFDLNSTGYEGKIKIVATDGPTGETVELELKIEQ